MITLLKYMNEWGLPTPSAAFRLTANMGQDMFYGNKYLLDIVGRFSTASSSPSLTVLGCCVFNRPQPFQNDGKLASGSTTIVHDVERKRLFMTGMFIFPALR
jgi:hypothetical protein